MQILSYFPGQTATFFLETLDGYGVRTDCIATPIVSKIVFPTLTLAANYPQNMSRLETGLYYFQFTLPSGASAVGSYLVDVSYIDPVKSIALSSLYQIVVTAPYGMFSTITI